MATEQTSNVATNNDAQTNAAHLPSRLPRSRMKGSEINVAWLILVLFLTQSCALAH
jgi:hypothetical protein